MNLTADKVKHINAAYTSCDDGSLKYLKWIILIAVGTESNDIDNETCHKYHSLNQLEDKVCLCVSVPLEIDDRLQNWYFENSDITPADVLDDTHEELLVV